MRLLVPKHLVKKYFVESQMQLTYHSNFYASFHRSRERHKRMESTQILNLQRKPQSSQIYLLEKVAYSNPNNFGSRQKDPVLFDIYSTSRYYHPSHINGYLKIKFKYYELYTDLECSTE